MKNIQTLKTLKPVYRTNVEDGSLDEVTVSFRKYPQDTARTFSVAVQHERYMRRSDGSVMTLAYGAIPKIEIERVRLRKGQSLTRALEEAIAVCDKVAVQDGYGPEPPTWFSQHQWDEEVKADIESAG